MPHFGDAVWLVVGCIAAMAILAILSSVASQIRDEIRIAELQIRIATLKAQRAAEARRMAQLAANTEFEVEIVGEGLPQPGAAAGQSAVEAVAA